MCQDWEPADSWGHLGIPGKDGSPIWGDERLGKKSARWKWDTDKGIVGGQKKGPETLCPSHCSGHQPAATTCAAHEDSAARGTQGEEAEEATPAGSAQRHPCPCEAWSTRSCLPAQASAHQALQRRCPLTSEYSEQSPPTQTQREQGKVWQLWRQDGLSLVAGGHPEGIGYVHASIRAFMPWHARHSSRAPPMNSHCGAGRGVPGECQA